jgi:hypothetical protein
VGHPLRGPAEIDYRAVELRSVGTITILDDV